MEVYDISILKKDETNENLYDLTEVTFQFVQIITFPYYVEPEDEMRLDNICNKLYDTTQYIDILMNLNDIDNPLNIKSGDLIIYVDRTYIKNLRAASSDAISKIKTYINLNKATRIDNTRKQYVEDNFSTKPTVQDSPKKQVKVSGNVVTIGDVKP